MVIEKYDGPTMLLIVLEKVDPSVIVATEVYRKKLEKIWMHDFNNNVDAMCSKIEELHQLIIDNKGTCESIDRYTRAALTSSPNPVFNSHIQQMYDDVEVGFGHNKDAKTRRISLLTVV